MNAATSSENFSVNLVTGCTPTKSLWPASAAHLSGARPNSAIVGEDRRYEAGHGA
jgi:hypothetical protein